LDTLLFTVEDIAGATQDILRRILLTATDGVIPSRLRFVLRSKNPDDLYSRHDLAFDFDVASAALAGFFNLGARLTDVASNVYTATHAGDYDFELGAALQMSGKIEYRIDGGSWSNLITSGTTGSITGVGIGETIEIRGTSLEGTEKPVQITMTAPSGGQNAYGFFWVGDLF
jgi:hypothetical protein